MTIARDPSVFAGRLELALRDTRAAIEKRRAAEEAVRRAERHAMASLREAEDDYVRRLAELVGRVRRPASFAPGVAAPPLSDHAPGNGLCGVRSGAQRDALPAAAQALTPPLDPELDAIVSAWKSLAAPARRAILSIVRGTLRHAVK